MSDQCNSVNHVNPEEAASFTDLIRPDLKDYCRAANLRFNEQIQAMIKAGQKVHHFGFGQAPFPVMEHMAEALKEFVTETRYLPVAGIPELREAICQFHVRHDGLTHLTPEDVIVGPGSKELIFLCMLVFNGDVLVLSPSWTTYRPQSRLTHHQAVVVDTTFEDQWKLTPEAVEKAVKDNNLTGNKLLIFCNPDNPTGTSYSAKELEALSVVFRKHSIIVISDEIYGRLHYKQEHQCLAKFYPEGTILNTGMSKWASAGGWRVGYHIYPPGLKTLRQSVHSGASHTYSTCPAPMQFAVAKALNDEDKCDDYMRHTARIMRAVGAYCHAQLTAAGVQATPPQGGYYMMPNFEIIREGLAARGITTGQQMCEAMFDECGVALMSGGPAFLRPLEELTTRMCFVNFDGAPGLAASRKLGLDCPLPDDFVSTYCKPVCDGVQALIGWVEKYKS